MNMMEEGYDEGDDEPNDEGDDNPFEYPEFYVYVNVTTNEVIFGALQTP
jgi:hypothetical protein